MPATPATERHPRVASVAIYGSAALLTLVSWVVVLPPEDPETVPPELLAKVLLDLVLGFGALLLLPFRHRFPFVIAAVTTAILAFSTAATGAWGVATVSFAKRREVTRSAALLVISTAAAMTSLWWIPPAAGEDQVPWWALLIVTALMTTLVLAVGFYLGARRDLVQTLHQRAETAEREQTSRMAQARVAERTRIAREMHDVLAHRISTVAMHSGALAYRTDLEPEQVHATARLIQENAHSALVELRDILGVLREDDRSVDGDRAPEPPQPTIVGLPDLVADAIRAGQDVTLELDVDPRTVPTALGRHVYRSVQECLTNARKHAPGSPVRVRVTRTSTGRHADLVVEVSNPLPDVLDLGTPPPRPRGSHSATAGRPFDVPRSGVGLLGLAERADLAGGRLDHGPCDDHYVTRLTVPWTERSSS